MWSVLNLGNFPPNDIVMFNSNMKVHIILLTFFSSIAESAVFAPDLENDEARKKLASGTWLMILAQNYKCLSEFKNSEDDQYFFEHYNRSIIRGKRTMANPNIGCTAIEIEKIEKQAKVESQSEMYQRFNRDYCMDLYNAGKELDDMFGK